MLARGLAAAVELLIVEQDRLRILVLLAASDTSLRLGQARTAHSVEFINLHLLRLTHVIRLGVVLDGYVAHRLTDWLLPQLLLRLLVVVRQVASLPNVLHRHGTVRSPSDGGCVLASRMQALPYELLGALGRVVQADLGRVRVGLLALLRAVLLVARLRVHVGLVLVAVRTAHDLRRLNLWVALMVHMVALGVRRAAALILATLTVHLLRLREARAARCDPVVHLHPRRAGLLHVDGGVLARRLRCLADWIDLSHLDHLRLLVALGL